METQYLTNDREYFPMLAQEPGVSPLPDEEVRNLWSRLDGADEDMKARLIDPETPDRIYRLAEELGIPKEKAAGVSVVVRDIGLGDVEQSGAEGVLKKKLPELSQESVEKILEFIREFFSSSWEPSELPEEEGAEDEEDSEDIREAPKNTPANVREMPLIEAMRKFPRLGQQAITSNPLAMRGSQSEVSPSVKNWITIYQQETGPAPHEAFERSNFLFHNTNALKLPQNERNILNAVLKSLDENELLKIDAMRQRILFEDSGNRPSVAGNQDPETGNRDSEAGTQQSTVSNRQNTRSKMPGIGNRQSAGRQMPTAGVAHAYDLPVAADPKRIGLSARLETPDEKPEAEEGNVFRRGGVRNQESETRNPATGIRNPKPGNRNPETANQEPGTKNRKPGNREPETGNPQNAERRTPETAKSGLRISGGNVSWDRHSEEEAYRIPRKNNGNAKNIQFSSGHTMEGEE